MSRKRKKFTGNALKPEIKKNFKYYGGFFINGLPHLGMGSKETTEDNCLPRLTIEIQKDNKNLQVLRSSYYHERSSSIGFLGCCIMKLLWHFFEVENKVTKKIVHFDYLIRL